MLFSSELKGIVDQCHVEDLILVPAGHYWTRESGLVDYYQPEWDCDGYSDKFTDPLNQNYTNGHTNGHHTNGNTNGNVEDHETNDDNAIKEKPAFKTEEDCKAVLEKAVIRRCMADVEIGLLLSGGLDSSILGAMMMQPHIKKHLTGLLLFFRNKWFMLDEILFLFTFFKHPTATGKLKSFAVGQEGSPDILAARAVAARLGTEHIEMIFTPEMAFEVMDKIIYYAETYEPELVRSCISNYFLAQKTSEHVKVVLTGEGMQYNLVLV